MPYSQIREGKRAMKKVRYHKEASPPDFEWWSWTCLKCKETNISQDDLSYETEVTCEQCGETFEPI